MPDIWPQPNSNMQQKQCLHSWQGFQAVQVSVCFWPREFLGFPLGWANNTGTHEMGEQQGIWSAPIPRGRPAKYVCINPGIRPQRAVGVCLTFWGVRAVSKRKEGVHSFFPSKILTLQITRSEQKHILLVNSSPAR